MAVPQPPASKELEPSVAEQHGKKFFHSLSLDSVGSGSSSSPVWPPDASAAC